MHTVYEYGRPIDHNAILEYRFDDEIKKRLAHQLIFEEEESHAAPEPSVACRVRTETGFEYALLYLQCTKRLLVLGEAGIDREAAISAFLADMPELMACRLSL